MKNERFSSRKKLSIGLLLLLSVLCVITLWKLAQGTNLGKNDFAGYWSATYLLHEGRNPYDPAGLKDVQNNVINTGLDYVVQAWNPPTLLVTLLPLAGLSFDAARAIWLVANVAMLFTISFMVAHLYLPPGRKIFLAFCLFVIFFPQALVVMTMGQVTLLGLLGLVGSMLLIKRGQWFWAGAFLILTSIKPHMFVLTVPYLLLYMAFRRRWQGWLGLACAGIIYLVVLFLIRPVWVMDFAGLLKMAPVNWATPTVGGLVSSLHVTESARYLVFLLLPLSWVFVRRQASISMESAVALLTVITVPLTFFGWSYDQTVLLIPIAQIFSWLPRLSNNALKIGVVIAILVSILLNWIQRVVSTDEVYYVWIPIFWAVIYGICTVAQKTTVDANAESMGLVDNANLIHPQGA